MILETSPLGTGTAFSVQIKYQSQKMYGVKRRHLMQCIIIDSNCKVFKDTTPNLTNASLLSGVILQKTLERVGAQ